MSDQRTNKIDLLLNELTNRISSFESSVRFYRRIFFWTSIATLILSSVITVVAGLKGLPESLKNPDYAQNAILLLSAVITIISGWGLFFSPRNSWLIFAATTNQLKALRGKIEFLRAPPGSAEIDEKVAAQLYAEYQDTLDAHNKAWLELRSATTSGPQSKAK